MKFSVKVYNKIKNLCASVVKKLLLKKMLFEKNAKKCQFLEKIDRRAYQILFFLAQTWWIVSLYHKNI
jgi:hypothetical protein